MGLGIWHSCRKFHNFYLVNIVLHVHLGGGVALIGDFLFWALLTSSWENHFFKYWRYTGKRNRSKKLVEKKARFGFVLYPLNFG